MLGVQFIYELQNSKHGLIQWFLYIFEAAYFQIGKTTRRNRQFYQQPSLQGRGLALMSGMVSCSGGD